MIEVGHKDLHEALKRLKVVSDRSGTLPVLGNVLVRTVKGELELVCTDLDRRLTTWMPFRGEGGLDLCLPVDKLAKLTAPPKGCNGNGIEIEPPDGENGRAVLRTKDETIRVLPGSPVEDFPAEITGRKFRLLGTYSRSQVRNVLAYTLTAVSSDETRNSLNCELWNGTEAVATDGYRLHMATFEGVREHKPVLVPRTALEALAKVMDKAEGELELWAAEGKESEPDCQVKTHAPVEAVSLRWGDWRLDCKGVVDGDYPDWNQAVGGCWRSEAALNVILDRDEIESKLDRAIKLVGASGSTVKFKVEDGQASMVVGEGSGPDQAEIEYKLSVRIEDNRYSDDDGLTAGFSLAYLRDAVKVPEDELTLHLLGELMPLGVTSESRAAAVMSMRI